jgi:hypothetical protein
MDSPTIRSGVKSGRKETAMTAVPERFQTTVEAQYVDKPGMRLAQNGSGLD